MSDITVSESYIDSVVDRLEDAEVKYFEQEADKYDDSSIELLKGAERIRKRPASMLGSSGLAGARHGFTEIYGNALDEHSAGYGDRLDVTYYKDGSISVRDYGRGVPIGWNDRADVQNWNWHVIYNELYGGAKYKTNQDALKRITDWKKFNPKDYNYLYSVGLNGLGAASTQYTSEFFIVRSYSNGVVKSRSFQRGIPLVNGEPYDMFTAKQEDIVNIPEEIDSTDEPNGTFIHWKPDSKVFDNVNIGSGWLLETCKDITGVAGIELHFYNEVTDEETVFPAGTLSDVLIDRGGSYLTESDKGDAVVLSSKAFNHGTMKVDAEDFVYVCECEVAIAFTGGNEVEPSCYHNSVKMASGVQYEAIYNAIDEFMKAKGRAQGMKIERRDYEGVMTVFVSSYSNYASFRNQTKDAVDDTFIYSIVKNTIIEKLNLEWQKHNKYLLEAVNSVMEEARNRIATKELSDLAKKTERMKREKAPDKFVSCVAYEEKRWKDVEVWFFEGDSALTSAKLARSRQFQAMYPLRGKGLNVAKAGIKKIIGNKEIKEMFNILGVGFDLNLKEGNLFRIEDLKAGKIIIGTDADEDGYQIRVLCFLIFYYLAPRLIEEGYVYIAETPRFGIELRNGERIYAHDDAERDRVVEEYAGQVVGVSRYKGLAEVPSEILRETTVHPDTRNLIPVTMDMASEVEREFIDALFGADKYKQRKSIISAILGADFETMLEDNALILGEVDDTDIEEDTEVEVV